MKDYLINIWSSGKFSELSEREIRDFCMAFGDWVKKLEDKNQLVVRYRIAGEFKSLTEGKDFSNRASFGGENHLSGVFIIKANSESEIAKIVKACPAGTHLKDTIEVVELAI